MKIDSELIEYVHTVFDEFRPKMRGNDQDTDRLAAYLTIAYMIKFHEKGPYKCELCGFRTFVVPPDNTCPHCEKRGTIVADLKKEE